MLRPPDLLMTFAIESRPPDDQTSHEPSEEREPDPPSRYSIRRSWTSSQNDTVTGPPTDALQQQCGIRADGDSCHGLKEKSRAKPEDLRQFRDILEAHPEITAQNSAKSVIGERCVASTELSQTEPLARRDRVSNLAGNLMLQLCGTQTDLSAVVRHRPNEGSRCAEDVDQRPLDRSGLNRPHVRRWWYSPRHTST